ncbi:MAG: hypothetical protein AAFW70_16155 [Cyanobacteria bacterium J06635_10]
MDDLSLIDDLFTILIKLVEIFPLILPPILPLKVSQISVSEALISFVLYEISPRFSSFGFIRFSIDLLLSLENYWFPKSIKFIPLILICDYAYLDLGEIINKLSRVTILALIIIFILNKNTNKRIFDILESIFTFFTRTRSIILRITITNPFFFILSAISFSSILSLLEISLSNLSTFLNDFFNSFSLLGFPLFAFIYIVDFTAYCFTLIPIKEPPLGWLLLGGLIGGDVGAILAFQNIKQYSYISKAIIITVIIICVLLFTSSWALNNRSC